MVGSDHPGDAELRGDSMEILDSDLSVSIHLSEVTEETLEAGWREHLEDAAGTRDHTPLRVRHPAGAEDQVTRPCLELGATDREDVLTLKDVKKLIVIVMDMQRCVERVDLFDDRERAAGGLSRSPDRELHAGIVETLPASCLDFVSRRPPAGRTRMIWISGHRQTHTFPLIQRRSSAATTRQSGPTCFTSARYSTPSFSVRITAQTHLVVLMGLRILPIIPTVEAKSTLPRLGHAQIVLPAKAVWEDWRAIDGTARTSATHHGPPLIQPCFDMLGEPILEDQARQNVDRLSRLSTCTTPALI
jgi:hypothetical protein